MDKETDTKIKSVYLQAFREKYGNALKPNLAFAFRFRYFVRGAGAGIAFMLIFFAFSTYADQQNVGAGSILYPLKRSQESVRMSLTGAASQPALHLEFAQRRLAEIKDVKSKDPQNPQIKTLNNDLKKEITESIATIQEDVIEATNSIRDIQSGSAASAPNPVAVPILNIPANQITPRYPIVSTASINQVSPPKSPENYNPGGQINFEKSDHEKEADKKRADICESWTEIIESEEGGVREAISNEPSFVTHFNEKCGGSFQFPKIPPESNKSDSGD
jgi:hypothetical protein